MLYPKLVSVLILDGDEAIKPCSHILEPNPKEDLAELARDVLCNNGHKRSVSADKWTFYSILGNSIISTQDVFDQQIPIVFLVYLGEEKRMQEIAKRMSAKYVLPPQKHSTTAWILGQNLLKEKEQPKTELKSILKKQKKPHEPRRYEKNTKNAMVRTAVKQIKISEEGKQKPVKKRQKKVEKEEPSSDTTQQGAEKSAENEEAESKQPVVAKIDNEKPKIPEDDLTPEIQRDRSSSFMQEGEPFFFKMGQKQQANPLGRNRDFFAKGAPHPLDKPAKKPQSSIKRWIVSATPKRPETLAKRSHPVPNEDKVEQRKRSLSNKTRQGSAATFTVENSLEYDANATEAIKEASLEVEDY